ncbi:hypothetical protein EDB89DRAFT_2125284 [Lactarius sanguifluus]|nr:hypothetical protein EDB89DRAFT_2125284 [Lactarius sanguifluus]
MNRHSATPTTARPTGIHNASAQVDGAGPQNESWFFLYLRSLIAVCWPALQKEIVAQFQSFMVLMWRLVVTRLQGEQRRMGLTANEAPRDLGTGGQPSRARTTSPRKVSWSYLRGVSLALSELCQDGNYGGDRIPLSAILDLMRQHQSAFAPLGPHAGRDVLKRLIQLANEGVVFFDPFKEYVTVPEATRQRYALRRRELLAKGVDPANLYVFGAAFTRGISTNERVTNAAVASYREQFLLTQGRTGNRSGAALTRKESLISIADAICPARLMPEIEGSNARADADAVVRRGHSIVTDVARIITSRLPDGGQAAGTSRASEPELRRGLSILPEMTAIVRQRDALEAQTDRLRTVLETSD